MKPTPRPRRAPGAARARGQAMLLTVVLIAVGAAAIVYTLATPGKVALENDAKTAAALVQARDALIGRAAADNTRPGSLPCPDVDNDGALTMGIDYGGGGACTSNVGRLPWRTLGLPDLRDGSGERLWYALSNNFRDASGVTINSGTPGQLTITGTAPAANVIAIVFAPGAALSTQLRSAANQNNVAHYLEGENSNGDTVFTTEATSTTFNDKLLPITREALFPVVEMRVAREVRASLLNYFNDPAPVTPRRYLPLAAAFPGDTATEATYRGYLPTAGTCPIVPSLAAYLPAWFVANNWQQYVVYAVAPRCTPKMVTNLISIDLSDPQPQCALSCTTAFVPPLVVQLCLVVSSVDPGAADCNNTTDGSPPGSLLTVGSTGSVRSIVAPASWPQTTPAQVRPCVAIGDCLEAVGASTENIDASDNYVYVRPVRSPTNNDTLLIVAP